MVTFNLYNVHVQVGVLMALVRDKTVTFNLHLYRLAYWWRLNLLVETYDITESIIQQKCSRAGILVKIPRKNTTIQHISKESVRKKSIARHFPQNGNPPLDAKNASQISIISRAVYGTPNSWLQRWKRWNKDQQYLPWIYTLSWHKQV